MDTVMGFIEFLTWIFRVTSFFVGMAAGALMVCLALTGWRYSRRYVLRRRWRQDRPLEARDGLEPQWRPYDPEIPQVGRRCVCHNRVLYPGERVLIWPEVGPGGLLHTAVYCEVAQAKIFEGEVQDVADVEAADG